MSLWKIVANWVLPIPLTLFVLLSLPLPKGIRHGILLFVQRVFDLPLVGAFKLLHVMLWITALAFLGTARNLHQLHQAEKEAVWQTPNMELNYLSKRWRAERNLWMAAFAFSAWVFLAAFYREAVRRLAAEARLVEMERSDFTATETRERDREASVSREVTSKAAGRDRTPASASPVKPNTSTAAHPAAADLVGSAPGRAAAAGGVQMRELRKDL